MTDKLEHFHSSSAYEILNEYCIGTLRTDEKITRTVSETEIKSVEFIDPSRPMLRQMWSSGYSKAFYLEQVHIPRHSKVSAPIFGHPLLEMFTKTPWWVIPLVWIPVSIFCAHVALKSLESWQVAGLFLLGILNWSILEYTIHRFVFHVDAILPDNRFGLTLHFLTHGIHHFLPMDKFVSDF